MLNAGGRFVGALNLNVVHHGMFMIHYLFILESLLEAADRASKLNRHHVSSLAQPLLSRLYYNIARSG